QMLSVTLDWHGATAVLTLVGEVDVVTVPRFEEKLSSALDERPAALVVNLEKVEFFASTGLSALVAAQQRASEDTAVRVVATNRAVLRPLEATGLDGTVPMYHSMDSALGEQ